MLELQRAMENPEDRNRNWFGKGRLAMPRRFLLQGLWVQSEERSGKSVPDQDSQGADVLDLVVALQVH